MKSRIHPAAFVDAKAEIGEGVEIGPGCVVGPHVVIGDRTRLIAHVYVDGHTSIGADCTIYPFAGLGAEPQDLSYKNEPTRLEIGANNVIREHATMHRGTTRGRSVTKIGDNGLFMGNVHIAHDCIVGDNVIVAQTATVGGHVVIGDYAFLGGLSGIHQHCRVGPHAFVGASALMTTDLIPFGSAIGNHAHLAGLNVVGLKRRGFSRDQIHDLRAAYRLLFAEEGTFQERIEDAAQIYAENVDVMKIVDFVRADAPRPLCMPRD
ncbi:MAG TPA: acyl-ACP--UDP-N-acetylglucosamine O-acyltransferase [Caulobacterales bacterium]|nr:acyl-ACP--UDP-N-acetylglucosamine O-acyltransferase [Caulobacterales bacterium]